MIISGKNFIQYISSETIQIRITEISTQLSNTYADKNPLCFIIMNGAFMFAADVLQKISFPLETAFIKIQSYTGMHSGAITEFSGLPDIQNRHIIILEDIIDTGNTLTYLTNKIKKQNPASIFTVALLQKNIKRQISADLIGFEIPDVFVVGFGLDFDSMGRNLSDIWQATD